MVKVGILLADDHTVIRNRLRAILEQRPDWEVVAEAADGPEAVQRTVDFEPQVAVIDLTLPVINGIEATRQIMRHSPATRVLVIGIHTDEAYWMKALQAGAAGYLLTYDADVQLMDAVDAVVAGKPFLSPAIACGTEVVSTGRGRES